MADVRETPVLFGADGTLLGIVSAPAGDRLPVGCLLYNMGGDHRIGPHRINVELARRLAGDGITALRFDLAGLGDSPAPAVARSSTEQATTDLRDAMDELERTHGLRRFVLLGMCSGAPSALASARTDPRVAGLFLFDGYAFPGLRARLSRAVRRLVALPFNPALREKFVRSIGRRFGRARRQDAQIYATDAHEHSAGFFRDAMNEVADRGVPSLLLYTASLGTTDRGRDQLGALAGERFARHAEYVFAPEMDHLLTSQVAQHAFLRIVGGWVARVARDDASGPCSASQAAAVPAGRAD